MINPFILPEAAYKLDSLAPEAGWASWLHEKKQTIPWESNLRLPRSSPSMETNKRALADLVNPIHSLIRAYREKYYLINDSLVSQIMS
jgi:hypothetical protein